MPGSVGALARAHHRGFAVVAGVPAEAALFDAAVFRAVERQPPVFELEHRVDGFAREHFSRVLVDQVIAALDGIVHIPFPAVLFHVSERRGHSALRRPGVGTGRIEFRDHRYVRSAFGVERGHQPGAAGSDDDRIEGMHLGHQRTPPITVIAPRVVMESQKRKRMTRTTRRAVRP